MTTRIPTVFCPFCNSKGQEKPVLAPMGVLFIEAEHSDQREAFQAPHFKYFCVKCNYSEIHTKVLTSA